MGGWWWVPVGLIVLVAVDRLGLWAETRGWIYWRRKRARSVGSGVLGGLAEVFQPNQIHYVREIKQGHTASTESGQGSDDDDGPGAVVGDA